jgi:hypothetical protein
MAVWFASLVVSILTSLSSVSPEIHLETVPDCSKGETIQAFSPQGFINGNRVFQTRKFGDAIYRDRATRFRCRVYSSDTGKVFWQTREEGKGSFTAWVLQSDESYKRYAHSAIIANFTVKRNEEAKDSLIINATVVDDKNPKIVRDTLLFTFELAPSKPEKPK